MSTVNSQYFVIKNNLALRKIIVSIKIRDKHNKWDRIRGEQTRKSNYGLGWKWNNVQQWPCASRHVDNILLVVEIIILNWRCVESLAGIQQNDDDDVGDDEG